MSNNLTRIPGLTTQESSIYQAALELGTDTIQHIAQKANLPRSTTYLVIDELKQKGLLSEVKQGKKTLITAEPPDKLISLLHHQQTRLNQDLTTINTLLPQLQAIQNTNQQKPLISYHQGFEGVKTILQKTLEAKEILVICSGYQTPRNEQIDQYMEQTYFPATNQHNIKTREIVTRDPDVDKYIQTYASDLHQIKISPTPPAKHHLDKLIFGSSVAIISYDTLNGTIIDHPHIAEFETSLFNQLWNTL